MRIIIHRGAKEIGGTCFEVASGTSRLIVDVGLPLRDWREQPRFSTPTRAFPATDERALAVPGLFRCGPPIDGILLSHAHADHSGLIQQTAPSIWVYCSKGTSKMMKAGSIFARQAVLDPERWAELTTEVPVRIGEFTVTPFSVDHSAFDAMAFLIEAGGKRLLYTGDFRMHGRKPGMAKALIDGIASPAVDVMVLEGTHFSTTPSRHRLHRSEQELQMQIEEHIRTSSGLILASFSPQNVDRLVTFYKAARRCNRILVADAYTAYVLHVVHGQCRQIPGPQAKAAICVYYNKRFTRRLNWKSVVRRFAHSPLEMQEIRDNPKRFVMVFRASMMALDFEGKLPAATSCLYSQWHGYTECPDWRECKAHLKRQGCSFVECHTSGHVFVADCVEFVRRIQPKCIVAIHTQAPAEFPKVFSNARVLRDGEALEIAS